MPSLLEVVLGTVGTRAVPIQALGDNQPVEAHTQVLEDTLAVALDTPAVPDTLVPEDTQVLEDTPEVAQDNQAVRDIQEEVLDNLVVALDNLEAVLGNQAVVLDDGQVDDLGGTVAKVACPSAAAEALSEVRHPS